MIKLCTLYRFVNLYLFSPNTRGKAVLGIRLIHPPISRKKNARRGSQECGTYFMRPPRACPCARGGLNRAETCTREEDFKIEERRAYGNHKSDRVKDDTMWGSSSVSIKVPGVRPGVSQVPSCRSCKTLSCLELEYYGFI